ncbi:MAG: DUF1989 domain-containing protein [Proteobacteria bacterium]|nr:DUF1989 domain-containing protein [Pseudomonadota bacterium]
MPLPVVAPADADQRRARKPVVVYPNGTLKRPDLSRLEKAKATLEKIDEVIVPPREGATFRAPKGHFIRIVSVDGPQVGDLNLWNADNLAERFFSGKTRALHATHVSTGDRLWSTMPYLRPLATISHDTLGWYGFDQDGGGIHDVIGTRCDPYTNRLLSGTDYHHCCHSNLTRALANELGVSWKEAEPHVHDVLNVFMCTGFTHDTKQYFMKASPVRPGDYLELFAEVDLIGALSACPGGDCGDSHSSDAVPCYPLKVEIWKPDLAALADWPFPPVSPYGGEP